MNYVQIVNGRVVDNIPAVLGDVPISERYHPDFLTKLIATDEPVELGLIYEGGEFVQDASVPPVPVPQEVTNFQARYVLMQMPGREEGRSLFDDVEDDLKAAGGVNWQAWQQSNHFVRSGLLINSLAANYNLTSEQVDELFRQAALVSV